MRNFKIGDIVRLKTNEGAKMVIKYVHGRVMLCTYWNSVSGRTEEAKIDAIALHLSEDEDEELTIKVVRE